MTNRLKNVFLYFHGEKNPYSYREMEPLYHSEISDRPDSNTVEEAVKLARGRVASVRPWFVKVELYTCCKQNLYTMTDSLLVRNTLCLLCRKTAVFYVAIDGMFSALKMGNVNAIDFKG